MVTGTLFNGISEGASYGDDWQMATNYPIVRLTSGANVYYVRTSEWNSTGVQRGINADTTYFTIPSTLPNTPYSLAVVANGISSDTVTFTFSICTEIEETASLNKDISVYPNPANSNVIVDFTSKQPGVYTIRLLDVMGSTISTGTGNAASGENKHQINLESIAKGIYILELQMGDVVNKVKLVVR
jgi:hypothetical protein